MATKTATADKAPDAARPTPRDIPERVTNATPNPIYLRTARGAVGDEVQFPEAKRSKEGRQVRHSVTLTPAQRKLLAEHDAFTKLIESGALVAG